MFVAGDNEERDSRPGQVGLVGCNSEGFRVEISSRRLYRRWRVETLLACSHVWPLLGAPGLEGHQGSYNRMQVGVVERLVILACALEVGADSH